MQKDDLNQILDRNIAWIENCDNKASIMLGALGVAVSMILAFDYATIILDVLKDKWSNATCSNIIFLILIALSLGALLYGGYKLIITLAPKTDYKKLGIDTSFQNNSVIFFSSIAKHSTYTKFLDTLKETDDNVYLNNISSQIYTCAKICDMKFKSYKQGLYFSVAGLLSFISLIALEYLL